MAEKRDWLDYVGTLGLPLAITIWGAVYAHGTDKAREAQAALDRDTGYLKLLASTNEQERLLGLKIIDQLSRENKFSPDFLPVVQALAVGRPSDQTVQTAQQVLSDALKTPVVQAAQQRNDAAETSPKQAPTGARVTPVYVQIAREDQRSEAQALTDALRAAGFATPGIEAVANGTTHTYVRYFGSQDRPAAEKVQAILTARNFPAAIQDFTKATSKPAAPIEIWIGSEQS